MEEEEKQKIQPKDEEPSAFCCCNCQCHDEVSKNDRFCGCFPVKCGIVFIGCFTFILLLCYWFMTLSLYMNEYFDWWYVTIMLVLWLPLAVAALLFFNFFLCGDGNTEGSRRKLTLACWLAIISIVLTEVWTCIYICCLYKHEHVYTGSHPWDEDQYIK